jgi:hypothetical protein
LVKKNMINNFLPFLKQFYKKHAFSEHGAF